MSEPLVDCVSFGVRPFVHLMGSKELHACVPGRWSIEQTETFLRGEYDGRELQSLDVNATRKCEKRPNYIHVEMR